MATGSSGSAQPWFVPGDIDGFFGLAIDNLIQFLLILGLCTGVLGFSTEIILGKILPGAGLSIIVGNVFYAWQAHKLSAATGRTDVTALPYGINTVSLFAYVFLVMLPVKLAAMKAGANPAEAATIAWQIGLVAGLLSGLIELVGSFVADKIRQVTPRAALLSTLAGIAISFISIDFAVRTFESPLLAMLPLAVILTTYFARVKMPLRIPGGAWAVIVGAALAWILFAAGDKASPVSTTGVSAAWKTVGFYFPIPVFGDLIAGFQNPIMWQFLVPVILPMGLFNVLGSLQNIESAEAAGDSFETLPSLAVNGAGSMVAAVFGSCFPTTIYIGHPGWKGLGARSGYSILNSVFFAAVALFGLTNLINSIVPLESGMAIVLWIGIIITAQAFQATPSRHASAVAVGLFPAIAAWGVLILTQTLGAAGMATKNMGLAGEVLKNPKAFAIAGVNLPGLVAISQGFMLTCMIWAAASACLIERRFQQASIWMGVGAVAAFFGFVHAGYLGPSGGIYTIGWATGARWAAGYVFCAVFFAVMGVWARKTNQLDNPATASEFGPMPSAASTQGKS